MFCGLYMAYPKKISICVWEECVFCCRQIECSLQVFKVYLIYSVNICCYLAVSLCLNDLSNIESELLKSSTIIVLPFISFGSVYFMYFSVWIWTHISLIYCPFYHYIMTFLSHIMIIFLSLHSYYMCVLNTKVSLLRALNHSFFINPAILCFW